MVLWKYGAVSVAMYEGFMEKSNGAKQNQVSPGGTKWNQVSPSETKWV